MAITHFKGTPVTLSGTEVEVGTKAPEVTVVASDLSEKTIGGTPKKKQLLVVVPSLDTPVCASEAREFNKRASLDAEVIVISMDLPFASKRFCTTEGIENLTVTSDFRNKSFASAYGVLIADGPLSGLTCRALFIIDEHGTLTYKEILNEITEEPNYDAVLAAL